MREGERGEREKEREIERDRERGGERLYLLPVTCVPEPSGS